LRLGLFYALIAHMGATEILTVVVVLIGIAGIVWLAIQKQDG